MSKPTSVEDQLRKSAPVAFIEATFSGTYFKTVSGGKDIASFEKKVKIPERWLHRDDIMPETLFTRFFAQRELGLEPGFTTIRQVKLTEVSSLPDDLTEERELAWSGSIEQLTRYAKRYARKVRPELYMSAHELKKAIKRAISAPEVFEVEQSEFAGGSVDENKQMFEELRALGYE